MKKLPSKCPCGKPAFRITRNCPVCRDCFEIEENDRRYAVSGKKLALEECEATKRQVRKGYRLACLKYGWDENVAWQPMNDAYTKG